MITEIHEAETKVPTPIGGQARSRSEAARNALESFADLYGYFATEAEVARALGWAERTAREWRTGVVRRPRRGKREEVLRLALLCQDASMYLAEPYDVGEWALSPSPQLPKGQSPAVFLQSGGSEALNTLCLHAFRSLPHPDEEASDDVVDTSSWPSGAELRVLAESDPAVAALVDSMGS